MQPLQRRALFILTLISGLVWMFVSADRNGTSTTSEITAPRQDFLAPDFTLQTTEGHSIRLSELRGQAILINLWATWCPPCRAEMPAIQKMYEEYREMGFVVLAINMTNQDNLTAIQPFLQEFHLTFPVLLDPTGETSRLYELRSLPSSYFIDKQGVIKEIVIGGPLAEALLRTRIEALLK